MTQNPIRDAQLADRQYAREKIIDRLERSTSGAKQLALVSRLTAVEQQILALRKGGAKP